MITRQTLHETKRRIMGASDFWSPGQKEVVLTLIQSNLEALDVLDGGMDAKERERQIRLALADLRAVIADIGTHNNDTFGQPKVIGDVAKAKLTLDLIDQMVKAKGPAWQRKWDWYQPRIEEEFGSA